MTRPTIGFRKRTCPQTAGGFSLLELLVSIVVLTVVLGAMTQFMSMLQLRYVRQQQVAGASQTGRTTLELLALDIGQAGYYPGVATSSSSALTAGTVLQWVAVGSVVGMYPGRVVQVGSSGDPAGIEDVTIAEVDPSGNQFRALITANHTITPVPVRASEAPFPDGVSSPTYPASNTLRLFGDIRGAGNGTMRYIEYRYTPGAAGTCTGRLVRSDTDVWATAQEPPVIVADNVCNDASALVFRFDTPSSPTVLGPFTFVTNVMVDLQVRAQQQTAAGTPAVEVTGAGGTKPIPLRQTFVPRNIMYALRVANDGLMGNLPVKPPTVPVPVP